MCVFVCAAAVPSNRDKSLIREHVAPSHHHTVHVTPPPAPTRKSVLCDGISKTKTTASFSLFCQARACDGRLRLRSCVTPPTITKSTSHTHTSLRIPAFCAVNPKRRLLRFIFYLFGQVRARDGRHVQGAHEEQCRGGRGQGPRGRRGRRRGPRGRRRRLRQGLADAPARGQRPQLPKCACCILLLSCVCRSPLGLHPPSARPIKRRAWHLFAHLLRRGVPWLVYLNKVHFFFVQIW